MTTKLTLAFGPQFHLYHAARDDDQVYLELSGVTVVLTTRCVVVPIPIPVWEVIRQYPGVDLSLAELSDAALRRVAEQQVATGGGLADVPREAQIARELATLKAQREQQRRIRQAIQALERLNRGG